MLKNIRNPEEMNKTGQEEDQKQKSRGRKGWPKEIRGIWLKEGQSLQKKRATRLDNMRAV